MRWATEPSGWPTTPTFAKGPMMNSRPIDTMQRARQLIARLRHLQLLEAKRGSVADSWRYASRAQRVRRAAGGGCGKGDELAAVA